MNLIKLVRQHRRLRQLDVARAAGIREGLLSKIETDRVVPSADVVRRLAEALGCTPADLGFSMEAGDDAHA